MVSERYLRLVAVADEVAWAENRALVNTTVEVLVGNGSGRKDHDTHRVSGRARDNRLVHVAPGDLQLVPGDVVSARVTYAAPHHLVADAEVAMVRPARVIPDSCGVGASPVASVGTGVSLGMPSLRA